MLWRCLLLLLVTSLCQVSLCQKDVRKEIEEAYLEAEKEIKHLDGETFTQEVAQGLYLVFLGAKWCKFCQILTPKWLQLQNKAAHMENRNVFVRKVECTVRENEGFCSDTMKVAAYPAIRLFFKGAAVQDYDQALEIDHLYKFLVDRADQYMPNSLTLPVDSAPQPERVGEKPSDYDEMETMFVKNVQKTDADDDSDILDRQVEDEIFKIQSLIDAAGTIPTGLNPKGQINHLTGSTFVEALEAGPMFVMFHAPWCSHCQKLAPIWEEFAREMKNKLNIAKLDCTTEAVLCKQHGIMGYPTLQYFAEGDAMVFSGSRTLESLREFVETIAGGQVVFPVKHSEIAELLKSSDVAFFYVYDMKHPPYNGKEVISAVRKLRGSIKIYVCPDTRALRTLGMPHAGSTLVVSKDHGTELALYSQPFTVDSVLGWIKSQRTPLVQEIDEQNFVPIFNSGNLIVMGCLLDPETDEESKSKIASMRDMAKSWNRFIAKSKMLSKEVIFVSVDGSRRHLANWLSRKYSLSTKQLPRLLIVDTKAETYFDTDADGKLLSFDENVVTATIADIIRVKRQGKSLGGYIGWIKKTIVKGISPVGMMILKHPFLMTVLAVGLIGLVIYLALSKDDTPPVYNEKPE